MEMKRKRNRMNVTNTRNNLIVNSKVANFK